MSQEHFKAVNLACALLAQAKHRAWNAFAALNNDALHTQEEVLRLNVYVTVLRNLRALLEEYPEDPYCVVPVLEEMRKTVFDSISHTMLELNVAAGNDQSGMSMSDISGLKHATDGPLYQASARLREMFEVFGIQSPEAGGKTT